MNRRKLLTAGLTGAAGVGAVGIGAVALGTAESGADAERDPRMEAMRDMRFEEDPDPTNHLSIHTREHMNRYVQTGSFIPNVDLVDQDGKAVRFYDDCVKGKIVLINFMYTKCRGKCPLVHGNLVQVQNLLGDRLGTEFTFYSISLDPEEDTPEVIKAYMANHGVKQGWTFLTGKHETTEYLRRALGFIDPDPVLDADRTNHAGIVLYGNDPMNRWAACPGQSVPEDLVYLLNRVQNGRLRYPQPTEGSPELIHDQSKIS